MRPPLVKPHAEIRQSQLITTYGPGAIIEFPQHSAIMGGLEGFGDPARLQEIVEPRLSDYLRPLVKGEIPKLYAPPPFERSDGGAPFCVRAWRFPEWLVVQHRATSAGNGTARRLVHAHDLTNGRFERQSVTATRFVRACSRGHVDDIDWYFFVHRGHLPCRDPLSLVETGTTGDLAELEVRCGCGKSRNLQETKNLHSSPLGRCSGARPWLGKSAKEHCDQPSRLLIRTASNAYFSHVVRILSVPDRGDLIDKAVTSHWDKLLIVDDAVSLQVVMRHPDVASALKSYQASEILEAVRRRKQGPRDHRPVKLVELDSIVAAPVGFGDDVPVDRDFHARKLPDAIWRSRAHWPQVEAVFQLHRLREVAALVGFTRLEPVMPDIQGDYPEDAPRSQLAIEPTWFPAVENRGEGILVQLHSEEVLAWLGRPEVEDRLRQLREGHARWKEARKSSHAYPGGAYVLLHTLSHLLLQSLSLRCGYPASSLRERIYVDTAAHRYGVLLYTASPDAEGTLGGLVLQARYLQEHLSYALRRAEICSHDPVCSNHIPGTRVEERFLHGAACHGCALIAETSCEMRNEHLDRALVVPILGDAQAAFFPSAS